MFAVKTSCCSLVVLGIGVSVVWGQETPRLNQVRVVSCAYADSMLGQNWDKGLVSASRGPDGTVLITSLIGGRIQTTIQMNVSVTYRDSTPPAQPHGNLHTIFFDDRRLAEALTRADTTSLTLLLDDTMSLNLGSPIEGSVRGASRGTFLAVNATLSRGAFLALARAKKGRVLVAGRTYPIGRQLLEEIARTYRAIVCMPPTSFPLRTASQ